MVTQKVNPTLEESRALVEESREEGWAKPSFAKELFLGKFELDLIHPYPQPAPEEARQTERFLREFSEFCAGLDGSVIERESAHSR